jgi:hypothetical protein
MEPIGEAMGLGDLFDTVVRVDQAVAGHDHSPFAQPVLGSRSGFAREGADQRVGAHAGESGHFPVVEGRIIARLKDLQKFSNAGMLRVAGARKKPVIGEHSPESCEGLWAIFPVLQGMIKKGEGERAQTAKSRGIHREAMQTPRPIGPIAFEKEVKKEMAHRVVQAAG